MKKYFVISLVLICFYRVGICAEVPKAARQIPLPKGTHLVADFSWFPDNKRIAMRLVHHYNNRDNNVIAVVNVESKTMKILTKSKDTHGNPACSPDGKTIAYIGPMGKGSTIWLMDANGNKKRRLINLRCWKCPAWSPDSRQLTFEAEGDIWVVNVDGSGLKQLTSGSGMRTHSKWSPYGNLIALQSCNEIRLMNADGSNQRLLTETVSKPGYQVMESDGFSWSSDGKQIVYTYRLISKKEPQVHYDGDIIPYEIWIVDIDGANKHCLTPEDVSCGHPVCLPSKKYILYLSVYEYVVTASGRLVSSFPEQNIWMVNLMGKNKKQLTNIGRISEFALSPDGSKVVFSTYGGNIFVLEIE